MNPLNYLDRPILIDCCRDGTISYRDKHKREPRLNNAALPVFSVNTVDEAKQIQVRFCALQYTEHPNQPGRPWYVLPGFGGELSDLEHVTEMFAEFYRLHVATAKPTTKPKMFDLTNRGAHVRKLASKRKK